jgi:hypothetical protein
MDNIIKETSLDELDFGDVLSSLVPGRRTALFRGEVTGTGLTTTLEETDNGFLVRHEQDAEPILDLNHAKRSLGRSYYAEDPDMHRVASVPLGVAYQWLAAYGVEAWNPDHIDKVKRLLNDPEWRYLKTAEVYI